MNDDEKLPLNTQVWYRSVQGSQTKYRARIAGRHPKRGGDYVLIVTDPRFKSGNVRGRTPEGPIIVVHAHAVEPVDPATLLAELAGRTTP